MKVLVASCGRTGTNITLEALMGSDNLTSVQREERSLFKNPRKLQQGYLEKTDTVYIPSLESIDEVMALNPDLKIVWTVRDFRDTILSKLYRGRAGGDLPYQADDATPQGCKEDILWMKRCHDYLVQTYPENIIVSKMESLLLNTKDHLLDLCSQLGLGYEEGMLRFSERTKLETKKKRYNNKIDKGQVSLWERVDTIYGGYFKNINLSELMDFATIMNQHWSYE